MVESVSQTGTVSVNGLISGLDTTSIIEQLIAVQTQRINLLETQQAVETQKVALFQQLQGLYLGVRTSANALKSSSLYDGKLGTSSDTAILSVTADSTASLGSHTITVKQLAANNQFVSNRFADTNITTLGTGTLTLTVGTGAGSVVTNITIDNTNNTLDGIQQAINNSAANVSADILKVDDSSSPFQLTVTAKDGGLSNAVTITHDATLKNVVTGEILGAGATTNTQDTDDSDAKTYALRHVPNTGTVAVKLGGATITASLSGPSTGLSAAATADGGTLVNGREYAYVVSAVDASGETLQSTITVATADANGSIDFSFDDVDGATSYRVYRVDDTEYATPGAGNAIAADFQTQDSLIGTVADDGSSNFTLSDTGQAQQASQSALAASTQGYTLTESSGAIAFRQNQTAQVTADYEYDLEFTEIQVAKDAEIVFGEGANALTIKKSSNSISDVIEGVTLDLKKVDTVNPIIVDVKQNTFSIQGSVQSFLDSLNEVNSFVEETAFFDNDTFEKGPLFSDPNLLSIRNRVSNIMTSRVDSIAPGQLRSMSEVGIELSGQTGNYQLNSTEFGKAISEKLPEVQALFGSVAIASDVDIEAVGFTDNTQSTDALGYLVNITQAAAQAEVIGVQDVSGGITVGETLTIIAEGKTATASLTNGMTSSAAVTEINTALTNASITNIIATYNSATGKITVRHDLYGSEHSFSMKSDKASGTAGTSGLGSTTAGTTVGHTGVDVKGTIDGESATGVGNILTGNTGNTKTDGLQLKVNITATNLVSEGALQGRVTVSRGIASQMEEYLAFLTDESREGPIQSAITKADSRVDDLQDTINLFTERAQRQRDKLLRDFASLEQALGTLQTTSNFLTGQLQQIAATSEAIIKK